MLGQRHNIEWHKVKTESIIGMKTVDGVSYKELFLIDYANLFNKTNLNAGCNNCIKDYHNKYINKFQIMENNCDYALKKKYIGISLTPGSSFKVNNNNITNKIGAKLFKKYGASAFDKYPTASKPKKAVEKTTSKVEPTNKSRNKVSRSKKQ